VHLILQREVKCNGTVSAVVLEAFSCCLVLGLVIDAVILKGHLSIKGYTWQHCGSAVHAENVSWQLHRPFVERKLVTLNRCMQVVISACTEPLERFHLHCRVDAAVLRRVRAEGTLLLRREDRLIGVNRVLAHCLIRDYWLQPAILHEGPTLLHHLGYLYLVLILMVVTSINRIPCISKLERVPSSALLS